MPAALTSTGTRTGTSSSLWRPGLTAGAVAAVATTAVAAIAHGAGGPVAAVAPPAAPAIAPGAGATFETAPGDAIPTAGFAQLTMLFTVVGIGIAAAIRRASAQPRTTFTHVALVLTMLSVMPDLGS